jgi:type IV pilus assembly protein PilM
VVSLFAAALMVIVPAIEVLALKSNKNMLQTNVNKLKGIETVVNDYNQAKAKADDASVFKQMTVNSDDTLHNFISHLEQSMPSDISINSMSVTSGAVSISGKASSKSSVAKFIQQLQDIDTVANVYVDSESEAKDNTDTIAATFSIKCTFTNVKAVN